MPGLLQHMLLVAPCHMSMPHLLPIATGVFQTSLTWAAWGLPKQEIKAREMEELSRTLAELGIAPDTQEAADAAEAAAKRAKKKKDKKAKGAEGDGLHHEAATNGTAAPAPAAAAVEEEPGAGEEAAAVDPAEVRLQGQCATVHGSVCRRPILYALDCIALAGEHALAPVLHQSEASAGSFSMHWVRWRPAEVCSEVHRQSGCWQRRRRPLRRSSRVVQQRWSRPGRPRSGPRRRASRKTLATSTRCALSPCRDSRASFEPNNISGG